LRQLCINLSEIFYLQSIAIHTFRAIVLKWVPDRPRVVAAVVLASIWTVIALIIGFGALTHLHEQYWGDTTYCESLPAKIGSQIILTTHDRVLDPVCLPRAADRPRLRLHVGDGLHEYYFIYPPGARYQREAIRRRASYTLPVERQ